MTKKLQFKFKGNREYVQGPDIFNSLIWLHRDVRIEKIDLRFNGIVDTGLLVVPNDALGEAKGYLEWTENNVSKSYKLISSDERVEGRYEYDEKCIIDRVSLLRDEKKSYIK